MKAAGVSDIYCVVVNDPAVSYAWGMSQRSGSKVKFLADVNAELVAHLNTTVEHPLLGRRTARFAMIVDHGIIDWVGIDSPNGEQGLDAMDNSNAFAVLHALK